MNEGGGTRSRVKCGAPFRSSLRLMLIVTWPVVSKSAHLPRAHLERASNPCSCHTVRELEAVY